MDDVVQEVFLVVHGRLHTVEQPESLRSWIYGVVRRTVSTYHRARTTRSAREAAEARLQPEPRHPTPFDLAVLSDEVQLLWRLLEELDPLKREAFILAELEEMRAPEIAEALGVPLNTAYSRIRLARHEFNQALARHKARERTRG